jgi:hypothetical protein
MKDGKEINDKSEKNVESKSLVQNKNDDKEKIAIQNNQNIKKENEPKQSINKNNEKNIEVKLSDDDIDHPMPLETDYEEEEKEEIKNNFYQNQLKEKEKMEKIKEMKKKEEDNYSNENNLKVVKKLEQSFNSVSKSIFKKKESNKKLNSSMNENKGKITKIKKMIPQKDIKTRAAKKIEKKVEDKENMNYNTLDKKIVKIDIKPQKFISENIEQNNIQKPNKGINQPKKTKKISRNQSFQKQNKFNIIKQNNKSEDILKNQINNIPQQNINHNNNTTSERLTAKIQNYMDYDNNIIYNNSINKTFKVEKPKYDEINFPNTEQNQRFDQIYYNDFENQLKENTQKKIVKNRLFKNRIGIKSQSYSNMNSNKICYNNIDNVNNNIFIDEKMNTQTNINRKVSKKIPFQKISPNNKSMNGYKDKKIKRIPVLLNGQKSINNKVIKNDLKDSHSVDGYFINKNKSQDFKISKNKEINNIHNNVGFYNNDQRDYFKNDSSRKKTIETGGKFNNIQTTYVVISKNTNSKIKLIPKSNKTIDYGINKCLNPIHSVIFPKSSNYYNQQPNTTYINSEENINNNQKIQFFSPYTKKQNYFQKIPSNNGIKTYKSQNYFQIKKNYCNNEDIDKNYGNNYKNYVGCSLHHNKMINNNQFMNNFYGTDKSLINSIDNCENYDYINYSCNNILNNEFFSYY